jgi:hypothetical protein
MVPAVEKSWQLKEIPMKNNSCEYTLRIERNKRRRYVWYLVDNGLGNKMSNNSAPGWGYVHKSDCLHCLEVTVGEERLLAAQEGISTEFDYDDRT